MKLRYSADTDTLSIDLADGAPARSREVARGLVLDFDSSGVVVGLDIENASKVVDMTRLQIEGFPTTNLTIK